MENSENIPLAMIFENIRTPDNLGALTRIAAAVGCQKIITTKVGDKIFFVFFFNVALKNDPQSKTSNII